MIDKTMNTKKPSEYTDREVMEKIAIYSKQTAYNTSFIKNYIIVITILSVLVGIFIVLE